MSSTATNLKQKIDRKIYPEILYFGKKVSECGPQPVFKQLLPDGEPSKLLPTPSQELYNHSPDGLQWGYGGSGPAQLALALLLDATSDPDKALANYQQFKWDKVATWGDEWRITRSEILLWLELQAGKRLLERINKN